MEALLSSQVLHPIFCLSLLLGSYEDRVSPQAEGGYAKGLADGLAEGFAETGLLKGLSAAMQ